MLKASEVRGSEDVVESMISLTSDLGLLRSMLGSVSTVELSVKTAKCKPGTSDGELAARHLRTNGDPARDQARDARIEGGIPSLQNLAHGMLATVRSREWTGIRQKRRIEGFKVAN